MSYKNISHAVRMSDEDITHAERDSVYVEGELAFEEGEQRVCNPYAASSPTLEQVWMNGWDHSRRIRKREDRHLASSI
jgi:hypothetical protein